MLFYGCCFESNGVRKYLIDVKKSTKSLSKLLFDDKISKMALLSKIDVMIHKKRTTRLVVPKYSIEVFN